MKHWQGYAHAAVVALSVWFCRETVFEALQWWHGRPPSDGLLLGSCFLLTGLACVPIVALHFSHVMVFPPTNLLLCYMLSFFIESLMIRSVMLIDKIHYSKRTCA